MNSASRLIDDTLDRVAFDQPRRRGTHLRIGSLFSGAGALDLAVEAVFQGRTARHVETDTNAAKVLAERFPGVPNLGDVSTIDWSAVEPVDVLCGGFPCQDVSSAGRRAGIASGTRSGLWLQFARAIDELRPSFVVIENVKGLLSAKAEANTTSDLESRYGNLGGRHPLRAAGAVLGDLADLGYDARWTTVSDSSVGASHRRERVFIVAHPAGQPWARAHGCSAATIAALARSGGAGSWRVVERAIPRANWVSVVDTTTMMEIDGLKVLAEVDAARLGQSSDIVWFGVNP